MLLPLTQDFGSQNQIKDKMKILKSSMRLLWMKLPIISQIVMYQKCQQVLELQVDAQQSKSVFE